MLLRILYSIIENNLGDNMEKVESDLELAHALIEDKEQIREYYSLFDRMWPFTTINMKEYLEPFDLRGKKCITIQGSSDHIFELFLKHPEKIIGVDTNPLTEYPYYLKNAAFAVLEKNEDFLKFFRWNDYPRFAKNNYQAFDKDVFQEIKKNLTGDAKIFWTELFDCHSSIEIRKNLFNQYDETNNQALYQLLNYLSAENYQYIRENRDQINFNFINIDIRELSDNLKEDVDFITLSNIIIYAHYMYKKNHLFKFKKLIESLSQKLNQNGKIIVGYLYDIENESDYRKIYNSEQRNSIFYEEEYGYILCRKVNDIHTGRESYNHDACLVYTKK